MPQINRCVQAGVFGDPLDLVLHPTECHTQVLWMQTALFRLWPATLFISPSLSLSPPVVSKQSGGRQQVAHLSRLPAVPCVYSNSSCVCAGCQPFLAGRRLAATPENPEPVLGDWNQTPLAELTVQTAQI